MAVAFGPEQFRQAGVGQGLTPPPSITLEESQRRAAEPEGEFGQYGTRSAERDAFEAYVEAVAPRTGMRELRVFFGTYKSHGLYESWVKIGRPIDPGVNPLPREIVEDLADKGITEEMLKAAGLPIAPPPTPPTPREQITAQLQAVEEAGRAPPLVDDGDDAGAPGIPPFPTTPLPEGFQWVFDRTVFQWVPQRAPTPPLQPEAQAPFRFEQPDGAEEDRYGRKKIWNPNSGRWEFPPNWNVDPATMEAGFISEWQRGQLKEMGASRLATARQFGQQLEAQREERLAQLAAQPISWLQHAALSGQQPVVQSWMIPLMRPGQNLQVGQPIPGFQPGAPGAAQQGGFLPGTATPAPVGNQFANLPELRRPSAQLFARMGPTAQQQFLGFRQARTGIPPQETLFRQRQGGPPGSSGGGFQQQRLRV